MKPRRCIDCDTVFESKREDVKRCWRCASVGQDVFRAYRAMEINGVRIPHSMEPDAFQTSDITDWQREWGVQ